MPANLPAGCIAEFEIRGTLSAVNTTNGIWTIGAPLGAMIGTPPAANAVPPFVVYESVAGKQPVPNLSAPDIPFQATLLKSLPIGTRRQPVLWSLKKSPILLRPASRSSLH